MKTEFHVMGSCHIDLAWHAEEAEYAVYLEQMTVVLLDMLEQFPEMTYVIEQAYHYRGLQQRRPDLVRRLREQIEKGRVEVVGGMASTMETNIPCAESFIRNQLLGLLWFEGNMGAKVQTAWLVDTFGCHAQVPQVLSSFGFRHLLANRFGGEKLHDVFYAKALNGDQVLVAGRDTMSVNLPEPRHSRVFHKQAVHHAQLDAFFDSVTQCETEGPVLVDAYLEEEWAPNRHLVYNVHALQQKMKARPDTSVGFSLPRRFFEALDKAEISFPMEDGDLNPEFSGTYAQRIEIRLENRRAETALLDAEKWLALTGVKHQPQFREAWWDMAFVHFHDVFTGSHPDRVFVDIMSRLGRIERLSGQAMEGIWGAATPLEADTQHIRVVNGLPFAREDRVTLPAKPGMGYRVFDAQGEIPVRQIGDRLVFEASVDACATSGYTCVSAPAPVGARRRPVPTATLENEHMRLIVDENEGISLVYKPGNRALLSGAKDILVLQQDNGNFQFEDIQGSERYAWVGDVRVEADSDGQFVVADGTFTDMGGALQAAWEIEFSLYPDEPLLSMEVRVDWAATAKRLRLKLNTPMTSAGEGIYEIPFGVVRRQAYSAGYNKKGEWPTQRFAAMQDTQGGLALINDGVPGVEILGGTLYTTLLRAPTAVYAGMVPDETSSQHGQHRFSFALMPYQGDWAKSGVLQAAQRWNVPLKAYYSKEASLPMDSMLAIDQPNILLSTVKWPEQETEQGIVLRLAEIAGETTTCRVSMPGCQSAHITDMKEDGREAVPCENGSFLLTFAPHQIHTVYVERGDRP